MNVVEISPTYDSVMTDDGEITSNIGPKVHPVKELKTMAQDVSNNKYNVGLHSVYIWDLQNKVADLSNNMEGVDADAIEQNSSNIAANNTSIVNLTDDLNDMKSNYIWRIGVGSITNMTNREIPTESQIAGLSDATGMLNWSDGNLLADGRYYGRQAGDLQYSGRTSFKSLGNASTDAYMLNFSLAVTSKSTPYNGDDMVKVQFIRQAGSYYLSLIHISEPTRLR